MSMAVVLAFDSQDVAGVIAGLDVLQTRFGKLMTQARTEYLPLDTGPSEDKRAEVIVHELLHLKVANHGPVFRALLKAYLSTKSTK